jgi:hypothetical protein
MYHFRGPYSSVISAALTCVGKTFFLNSNAYGATLILATALECTEWGSVHSAPLKICQLTKVC